MIILFEGPDKTGKTTLAKLMSYRLTMPLFVPPRSQYDNERYDYKEQNECFYEGVNKTVLEVCKSMDNFILDRFFISDFVYSVFYGRKANLDISEIVKIKQKVLIVLTSATVDDQKSRGFHGLAVAQMQLQSLLFKNYFDIYIQKFPPNFKFLNIDTSISNEEDCAFAVQQTISYFEEE